STWATTAACYPRPVPRLRADPLLHRSENGTHRRNILRRLDEPLAVPRTAFARLSLAVHTPPSLGHRRHHFHAGGHRAIGDVGDARVEGARADIESARESL